MAKRQHSYDSGRIQRTGLAQDGYEEYTPPPKKKKRSAKKVLIALSLVLVLGGGLLAGLYLYISGFLDPGAFGLIYRDERYVPRDYDGDAVNILIVGIDYEDGRSYAGGLGFTDMILYANFDVKNNRLNLLQIPRDTYVGENLATGSSGKINALLMHGPDKENPINNLADMLEQQYKLPVDHYIAMDMQALRHIVDTFGGIYVFVPREMSHDGSYLAQGWQWMDGNAAEFFVRNRYGPGFEQADLARLENQRHFYSALFRRFMNLTPKDIVNLMPVFKHYCNTDMTVSDMMDIAFTALNLQNEGVLFCRVPGATSPDLDPSGRGRSMFFVDVHGRGTDEEPGLAALLNLYFRAHSQQVPAADFEAPNVNLTGYTLYPPAVQIMGEVQEGEGGAEIDVEPKWD